MCARSIMLNILGEADGEEGMARAHEVMARAYAVRHAHVILSCGRLQGCTGHGARLRGAAGLCDSVLRCARMQRSGGSKVTHILPEAQAARLNYQAGGRR